MVFSIIDIVIIALGVIYLIFWIFLYVKGIKNSNLFDSLKEKEYPLKEVYFVGYALVELINYQFKSKSNRKLRKEISVLYGEKYADYYLRVKKKKKITIASIVLALAFILYGFADSIAAFFVLVAFAGVAYYYFGTVTEKRILKRSEEMLSDFSNVVSKLALMTNAGMILREAWEQIAFTGETTIYKEMQTSVDEMKNGVSEVDALYRFGTRCIIPEIKKFTSTIIQGLIKGNRELVFMLQEQSREVWSQKKQAVNRQGEKAASKLLIPIMIMFVGILIMILVPIFTNIGT